MALFRILLLSTVLTLLPAGCGNETPPPATNASAPDPVQLTVYNWAEYIPQSVMDQFTRESGIRIDYVVYDSLEEAVANIRAGKVYDVVLLYPEMIPALIRENLLAPIDYRNVPNFRHVSPNFRDLSFDPGNRHSIPYRWGTTGLLVRTDLIPRPITRWSDLWDPAFAGKIALWSIPSNLFSIALKALGHSVNTTDPAHWEAALDHLKKLKANAFFIDNKTPSIVPTLAEGKAMIAYGWAFDAMTARNEGLGNIAYILPEEGTFLWMEFFVIPANSPHRREAERFLDFLLRPEVAGAIVNESYYAAPSEAAAPFIKPEILNNPLVYPSTADLAKAEPSLPLSNEGEALFEAMVTRFFARGDTKP